MCISSRRFGRGGEVWPGYLGDYEMKGGLDLRETQTTAHVAELNWYYNIPPHALFTKLSLTLQAYNILKDTKMRVSSS